MEESSLTFLLIRGSGALGSYSSFSWVDNGEMRNCPGEGCRLVFTTIFNQNVDCFYELLNLYVHLSS